MFEIKKKKKKLEMNACYKRKRKLIIISNFPKFLEKNNF